MNKMRKLTRRDGKKFICSIMYYAMWGAVLTASICALGVGILFSNVTIILGATLTLGISLYQNIKFYRKIADCYSDLCNTGVYDE